MNPRGNEFQTVEELLKVAVQRIYRTELAKTSERVKRMEMEIQQLKSKVEEVTREKDKKDEELQAMKQIMIKSGVTSSLWPTLHEEEGVNANQSTIPDEGAEGCAPETTQNMVATAAENVTLSTSEPEPVQDVPEVPEVPEVEMPIDTCDTNDGRVRVEGEEVLHGPAPMEEAAGSDSIVNENIESVAPAAPNLITMAEIKDEPEDNDSGNANSLTTQQEEPFLMMPDAFFYLKTLQRAGIRKKGGRSYHTRQWTNNGGKNVDNDHLKVLDSLMYGNERDRTLFHLRPSTGTGAVNRKYRKRGSSQNLLWSDDVRIFHQEKQVDNAQNIFRCNCGDDSFRSLVGLRNHMRYYNAEWKLICKDCNKRFQALSALKNHSKKVHKSNDLDGVKFSCTKCGHLFQTKKAKVIHQNLDCKKKSTRK